MEVFLARQPIFDTSLKVVAYEILYRSGNKNTYDISINGDLATTSVVIDALINFGIGQLAGEKGVFVNFTRNLLIEDLPFVFEPDRLTVEILETLDVDALLVEKCRILKERGYTIALDDFTGDDRFDDLMPYVDIIKVDFLVLQSEGRQYIAEKYLPLGVKLLAEKVETNEDYLEAVDLGYHFFQGYFFEKPIICKSKGISHSSLRYMSLLNETMSEEPDFKHLAEIIKQDYSLTYKLLRLINSPAFYTVQEITSVNHALTLLGLNEIRKWTTLILLKDISEDKPDELLKVSLSRALFAEKLSVLFGMDNRSTEAFLLGLFSLIDTVLEKPVYDIIEPLPLHDDIKCAMIGGNNTFHEILRLMKHYELGNWDIVIDIEEQHHLSSERVNDYYLAAVSEATNLFNQM